jgi:hypothetical protein
MQQEGDAGAQTDTDDELGEAGAQDLPDFVIDPVTYLQIENPVLLHVKTQDGKIVGGSVVSRETYEKIMGLLPAQRLDPVYQLPIVGYVTHDAFNAVIQYVTAYHPFLSALSLEEKLLALLTACGDYKLELDALLLKNVVVNQAHVDAAVAEHRYLFTPMLDRCISPETLNWDKWFIKASEMLDADLLKQLFEKAISPTNDCKEIMSKKVAETFCAKLRRSLIKEKVRAVTPHIQHDPVFGYFAIPLLISVVIPIATALVMATYHPGYHPENLIDISAHMQDVCREMNPSLCGQNDASEASYANRMTWCYGYQLRCHKGSKYDEYSFSDELTDEGYKRGLTSATLYLALFFGPLVLTVLLWCFLLLDNYTNLFSGFHRPLLENEATPKAASEKAGPTLRCDKNAVETIQDHFLACVATLQEGDVFSNEPALNVLREFDTQALEPLEACLDSALKSCRGETKAVSATFSMEEGGAAQNSGTLSSDSAAFTKSL